jgi:hypothetical protein
VFSHVFAVVFLFFSQKAAQNEKGALAVFSFLRLEAVLRCLEP